MADDHDIPAYPYMFDPSQFSNKYSTYAGKALPWPSQYSGTPTDAHGNPIQSYLDTQKQHDAWAAANPAPAVAPSTTLNSNAGLEAQGSQARAMQDAGYGDWAMLDPMMAQANRPNPTAGAGSVGATKGWNPANPASIYPTSAGGAAGGGAGGGGGAAAAAAQTNPYDMNQAYLTALSNPGHVTTPGATVAQAAPPSSQSGVLQQFLQNWGGNSKGAGNYDNSGFINSLRGMV